MVSALTLTAIRETQTEHGQKLDAIDGKLRSSRRSRPPQAGCPKARGVFWR
jgi:hypothetical protein